MKSTLTKIFLSCLVLVLIISTTALGVLFYLKFNESNDLNGKLTKVNSDLADAQNQIKDLQGKVVTTLSFSDSGLGFTVKYPSTWTMSSKTTLSDVGSTGAIPEIHNYSLIFTKSGNVLTFAKIFGGVGDIAVPYPKATFDVKEIGTKVLRVSEKGKNKWNYVSKVDCKDSVDPVTDPTTLCGTGGFFPGFGSAGATTVVLVSSDASVISEADTIIQSTL